MEPDLASCVTERRLGASLGHFLVPEESESRPTHLRRKAPSPPIETQGSPAGPFVGARDRSPEAVREQTWQWRVWEFSSSRVHWN